MSTTTLSDSWQLSDRVDVTGGTVATDVRGDGPPVVLVHGTPAWSFLWRNVVPELARSHTVHTWDMLGFGDSRVATGVAPSFALQASTLAELVRHWELPTTGPEAPILVGHDIGGGVVMRAHLSEGVGASGLVLLDAAVIGPWNTAFTDHQQQHAAAYRSMPNDTFADLTATRLQTATQREMTPETLAAYYAPWTGPEGQGRWVDQVSAVSYRDLAGTVELLNTVAAPTRVLWGEQDGWLPTSMGHELAAAIPGARLDLVPGAGHFLPEDRPDAVVTAVHSLRGA